VHLLEQYRSAIRLAFPEIISHSQTIEKYWDTLEKYFPHTQIFMIDADNNLMGFINAIPVFWDQPVEELPKNGWDWLLEKGITDSEDGIAPNMLGGLQIIITKKYQGKGYSKLLIEKGKSSREALGFNNFIIPIRPILKHQYPEMRMKDYMILKEHHKIYDPWIRTHLSSGAKIIKVCENSMSVTGDIHFWGNLMNKKITESGFYRVEGALNLVFIEIEKGYGAYKEENIWIQYPSE